MCYTRLWNWCPKDRFCFLLVVLEFSIDSYDLPTNALHGCVTGTRTIIRFLQCIEVTLKDMGKRPVPSATHGELCANVSGCNGKAIRNSFKFLTMEYFNGKICWIVQIYLYRTILNEYIMFIHTLHTGDMNEMMWAHNVYNKQMNFKSVYTSTASPLWPCDLMI